MADPKNSWSFGGEDPFAVSTPQPGSAPSVSTSPAKMSAAGSESPAGFPMTAEELHAYAHYYKLADPVGKGSVQPQEAVTFLSKSRLPQHLLGEIWQQANSDGKGFLTKTDFYKAVKMIALAQGGKSPNVASLNTGTSLPVFDGVTVPSRGNAPAGTPNVSSPQVGSGSAFPSPMNPLTMQRTGGSVGSHNTGNAPIGAASRLVSHVTGGGISTHSTGSGVGGGAITPDERERFIAAFESCHPSPDGYVLGDAARDLFLKSTLPLDVLSKIWILVDANGSGKLDLPQFVVAMYLISKIRQGAIATVPTMIPQQLWTAAQNVAPDGNKESPFGNLPPPPSANRTLNRMSTVSPAMTSPRLERRRTMMPTSTIPTPNAEWGIKEDEKAQFDQYFDTLDTTKRGFVTGQESYEFFTKAKLPQLELAKIWDLADIGKTGQLSKDEFAVAMHLIRGRMTGTTLPNTLPADLVPPSLRGRGSFGTPGLPQTPGAKSVMGDNDPLGDFQTASNVSAPLSLFDARARSFSKMPSPHEVAELQDRENELSNRKNDLHGVEQQLSSMQPSVEELRQRRTALDAEFKEVTDKRNELALKLSQLRAVYETESQIAVETENTLIREQQNLNISIAEVKQAEDTVAMLQNEKHSLQQEVERTRQQNDDIARRVQQANEATVPLRADLDRLRAELRQHQQHREVNEKVLMSAQAEYQQIHGDVQAEQAKLAQEKERVAHIAQQIAVQAGIAEKEKQKLKALAAERAQEQAKAAAAPAPKPAESVDLYSAFAELNSSQDLLGTTKSIASEKPPAFPNLTMPTGVASTAPSSATPQTPSAKKPPPPPPASKKPHRDSRAGSNADLAGLGLIGGDGAAGGTPTLARVDSTSALGAGVARTNSMSSVASTKAKQEFDALFESNKPKTAAPAPIPRPTTPAPIAPSPAAGTTIPRPSTPSPDKASPSRINTGSPTRPPPPAPPTPRGQSPGPQVPPSPGSSPTKKPASLKGFSLGFEPRKDVNSGDHSMKPASVRSVPLFESEEKDSAQVLAPTPLSAPAKSTADLFGTAEVDFAGAFGGAPPALVPTTSASASPAQDASASAARPAQSPADVGFGIGSADQMAGFGTPAFDLSSDDIFPAVALQNAPAGPSPAPSQPLGPSAFDADFESNFGSLQSDNNSGSTPALPKPATVKSDDAFSAMSAIDIDAEMENAFIESNATEAERVKRAATPDFDTQGFAAKDFDDDAFEFTATFDNASMKSMGKTGKLTQSPKFEAAFDTAFPPASNDPFAASDPFGFKASPPRTSTAAAQMSVADMDAVFGGGPNTAKPEQNGTATANGFDDVFGSFQAAFPPVGASSSTAPSTSPTNIDTAKSKAASPGKKPAPPLPQRAATTDDADEVKQITALGFTKEQAINALELNAFDVAQATNYLLDASK